MNLGMNDWKAYIYIYMCKKYQNNNHNIKKTNLELTHPTHTNQTNHNINIQSNPITIKKGHRHLFCRILLYYRNDSPLVQRELQQYKPTS